MGAHNAGEEQDVIKKRQQVTITVQMQLSLSSLVERFAQPERRRVLCSAAHVGFQQTVQADGNKNTHGTLLRDMGNAPKIRHHIISAI